jgi:hypothetical protein
MRDIPPGAVRAELKRTGAISEGANGIIRVLTREFVPIDAETKLVEGLEAGLVPLARTIGFNADPERVTLARFQRVAAIPFVKKGMVRQVETELNDKLRVITRELDDYLTEFEATENDPNRCEGLGVGIYYFREVE